MIVKFKYPVAYELLKSKAINSDYSLRMAFEETNPDRRAQNEELSHQVDLALMSKEACENLLSKCFKIGIHSNTIAVIERWLDMLDNPAEGQITSLQSMEKVLQAFYKKSPVKWLWKKMNDGSFVPYVIDEIRYKTGSRDDSPRVYISLKRSSLTKENSEDSKYVNFYKGETLGYDDELENYFEDDEEEGAKKPAKKKSKTLMLHEILAKQGYYLHTQKLMEKYLSEKSSFMSTRKMIGGLFLSNATSGQSVSKSSYSWDSDQSNWIPLVSEEGQSKLIVDIQHFEDLPTSNTTSKDYGVVHNAVHHYIKCYDIIKHREVFVHSDTMSPYQYNKNIIDNLILPEVDKKMLRLIVEEELELSDDIIKGKGGGLIILASGSPGTGKTLTAEVYSEYLSKPLYQIQSAQLGVSIESIEKNLREVLYRADRWGAVLLIDEADSYVFERGRDIVQNCIVGTFLRLLEYFNGVMFLTTNRHDMIDPAIKSRVVAHFKYEVPDSKDRFKIWKMLCSNYQLNCNEDTMQIAANSYVCSGRDIRNTIKLLKKIYKDNEVTPADVQEIQRFRPVISG